MIDTATHPYFGAASMRGKKVLSWLEGTAAPRPLTASPTAPVVCLYDGSAGARRAIEHAAELFAGGPALVVCLWEPTEAAFLARPAGPAGLGYVAPLSLELDIATVSWAERTASEGAALASEHGLSASPLAVSAPAPLWRAVVDLASEHGARAVVLGARGRSCAKALVAGSLSHAAIHRCPCPVLVVGPEAGYPARVEGHRPVRAALELVEEQNHERHPALA